MKNKYRAVFALLLAVALMLGAAALAADSVVSFTPGRAIAFAPGGATGSDLFDGFKGVMPGDVLEERITIENKNTEFDYLKVYLRAIPHDAQNQPRIGVDHALSNDFLSQLSMKVWNGSALIYSDSPDLPGALANSVYLGQLSAGQSMELKVELNVPIELDNEYAKRVGEVDWEFTFEGFDVDVLTVRKIWTGDTRSLPEAVQVQLYRGDAVYDTKTLSAANQWTHTWGNLDQDYSWDVKELAVEGYTTSYLREGNDILITNHKPLPDPPPPTGERDLTVVKQWEKDDNKHPDSVTVALYDGKNVADRVTLSAKNGWTHTWEKLSDSGQWRVVETNINGNYVPWYATKGDVVTVTNVRKLIQTGQLFWPIPVLGGLGILFVIYGILIAKKKRKDDRAQ